MGAAQRGGPGGFAAGYIGKLSQQRAQQRQDLKDQFGIENELLNIEQTVLAKGIDSADKAERVLSEEKRAYASAMSQAATGDISAAEKEAERILDANIQNIKTELDLLGQETDRAIAAAELRGASRKEMQELLKAEMERRDALLAPVVAGLIDRAMVPGADTEALVNRAALVKGFILEQNNIFAREQDILRRLEALGVNVSSQRGASAQQQQRSALMDQYLKSQQ
jgi:Na+-transporting NADH:ubiquinone oxidoreductase subunit NqrA